MVVQMNTRIDALLKERGDKVLMKAGLTPTKAVRGLWELAVRHEEEPELLAEVLSGASLLPPKAEGSASPGVTDRLAALHEGWDIVRNSGLSARAVEFCLSDATPLEELRERAARERLGHAAGPDADAPKVSE